MMIVEQMLKNAQTPLLYIADVSGSALFQGDCLDIMPLIPDKSVQLILADLPYGTTNCSWDSIIPFKNLWDNYERIVKDNGAIILTASQPFTTALINSNMKLFRYEWIYEKGQGTNYVLAKKQPIKNHENICVFYKQQPIYNPIMEEKCLDTKKRQKRNHFATEIRSDHNILNFRNYDSFNSDLGYPKTVQYFKGERNNQFKKNVFHPTQKPLELMKYLIKTYTNENDMVLDNTMGSGTTCLAAKELNRKFIGIEKEPKYYEIACQRCGF